MRTRRGRRLKGRPIKRRFLVEDQRGKGRQKNSAFRFGDLSVQRENLGRPRGNLFHGPNRKRARRGKKDLALEGPAMSKGPGSLGGVWKQSLGGAARRPENCPFRNCLKKLGESQDRGGKRGPRLRERESRSPGLPNDCGGTRHTMDEKWKKRAKK